MFHSGGCLYFVTAKSEKGFFPGVHFVNINLPEERLKIFQTEEQLQILVSLPEDSTDIFLKNNINKRYLARPSVSFCDGKYSILDSFCLADVTAFYSLIHKHEETNNSEEY